MALPSDFHSGDRRAAAEQIDGQRESRLSVQLLLPESLCQFIS